MSHTAEHRPRGALLLGSVPLASAEAVFRLAGATLGRHLRRIPDGETGVRTYWMVWQLPVVAENPAVSMRGAGAIRPFLRAYARSSVLRRVFNAAMAGSQAGGMVLAQIRPGVRDEDITFAPLGYATAAIESYRLFARLKEQGVVPGHARFQVSLPTPVAPLDAFSAQDQRRLLPAYEARLLAEIDDMLAAIPPAELALQWDVAVEFAMLEGVWPSPFGRATDSRGPIVDMLVRVGNHVPREVELGYHLCYGDAAHKHFVEPVDTRLMTEVANETAARLSRPMTWLHFPVPRGRGDDAYFSPLRELRLDEQTELYAGLVHQSDAPDGARGRIATAQRVLDREFGIATECGLGRRQPRTIPGLLRLHAELAAPVA